MWNEGRHIITLTHIEDELRGVQYFVCSCGEKALGQGKVVAARIMAHRMENFPKVREALT